jgi:hypothetical protein
MACVTLAAVFATLALGAVVLFPTLSSASRDGLTPSPRKAVNVTTDGARLIGQVDPGGLPTTAQFEYGIDGRDRFPAPSSTVYDQTTAWQSVPEAGGATTVTARVTGVLPNTVYHERVVARNAGGTTYGPDTPFRTAADSGSSAGPPDLGSTEVVAPVSGVVFVRPPRREKVYPLAAPSASGFVPLTEPRRLPVGTQVDARLGSARFIAAIPQSRKTQAVVIVGGVFDFVQAVGGTIPGLSTFTLVYGKFRGAPSLRSCAFHASQASARIARSPAPRPRPKGTHTRVLQTLKARDNHGAFRTRGRFSSATVRGTKWWTLDRCDGTFTVVHAGSVVIDDFKLRKTFVLQAPLGYLAKG